MYRAALPCSAIIAEVRVALRVAAAPRLSLASINHISECPRCHTGLLLLVKASAADDAQQPAECFGDQAQLAAFLEIERADPAQAVMLYAAVWQHIWSCANCLEDYLLAHALLAAENSGAFPPLQLPPQTPAPNPGLAPLHFVLTRRLLQLVLPPNCACAPQRCGADGHLLLADMVEGARQITITAYQHDATSWNIKVTCAPAIAGSLLLSVGDERYSAPFLPGGAALICQLPSSLVIAPDAPALGFSIVPT